MTTSRRTFLAGLGTAAALHGMQPAGPRVGVELGCISSAKFSPFQYLDYLAKIRLNVAQFNASTLGVNPMSPDEDTIRRVRDYAAKLGITTPAFSAGCICPSSSAFNAKLGTAEEQIAQGLKLSRMMGSTAMRAVVGGFKERPEIEVHAANLARVLKGMRSQIRDSGVRVAMENHGGDFQAHEMKALIEDVGHDVVGVCLDSGNPLWMMEDPHRTLELLGPYALVTHVRDTAVWRVPEGVAIRWVNMGEGNVDIDGWVRKFRALKPALPVTLENIVSGQPRIAKVFDPTYMADYRKMPASDLAQFLALAEKGKPLPSPALPEGKSRSQQQLDDLEVCAKYVRQLVAA